MSLLPPDARLAISEAFECDQLFTDLEFVRSTAEQLHDPLHRRHSSLVTLKSRIFDLSPNRFVPVTSLQLSEPISTSLDSVFGGPFYRGEVTSVEGSAGSGKTRMLVKISHEVSLLGKVLYIDSDFTLQPNILDAIRQTLGLENTMPASFCPDVDSSFNICLASNPGDLYQTINAYCQVNHPDLIIIDSIMSLLQAAPVKDGPGSALLQELAIELKCIAKDYNCVVIVSNVLKADGFPFLGRLYTSLWHQRLVMKTRNFLATKCELVQSPRFPYQTAKIIIETLLQCPEDDVAGFEPIA
jgi:archaellum biogenesis ATPase FlaH